MSTCPGAVVSNTTDVTELKGFGDTTNAGIGRTGPRVLSPNIQPSGSRLTGVYPGRHLSADQISTPFLGTHFNKIIVRDSEILPTRSR